jgi:DNA invertase Pin-like site-specific DNA recombinase
MIMMKAVMAILRAIIYLRVSTDEQAENKNGLNAQEDAARAYAARLGLEVAGVFTDAGITGSVGLERRPALLDAIAALSKGDVLLVAKRDRIGRLDPMAMAMIEAAVRRKGARIVSAAGEGTEDDDPSSILMRRMVDAFAEYERLIIRARTKAALRAKRKRNEKTGGPLPYGFERGPDKPGPKDKSIKTLVPCKAEQEVLVLMKALRAGGMTLDGIADELNGRGIKRREGAAWEHSYISRLLKKTA